jgi:hypothetical protein
MTRFAFVASLALVIVPAHAGTTTPAGPPAAPVDAPPGPETGGTFRLKSPPAAKHLAVGCVNHRTLKFVVNSHDGPDPAEAKLLAERDCRPIDKDASYVRCAPGGLAFPATSAPETFSSYCRTGAADLHMYVLDTLMEPVK